MANKDNDALFVLAAAYDEVDTAVSDYEAVKAALPRGQLVQRLRRGCDRDRRGRKGPIVKKHEQPTRHGAGVGLGWGLAVGAAAGLFPPSDRRAAAGGRRGDRRMLVTRRWDVAQRPEGLGDTLDAGQAA